MRLLAKEEQLVAEEAAVTAAAAAAKRVLFEVRHRSRAVRQAAQGLLRGAGRSTRGRDLATVARAGRAARQDIESGPAGAARHDAEAGTWRAPQVPAHAHTLALTRITRASTGAGSEQFHWLDSDRSPRRERESE